MKILLVDDEKSIAITLRDDLVEVGHEVTLAYDGQLAIDTLQRKSFDLMISDIRMPGADGMTLLKLARNRYPAVQVILITGYGTIDQAVQAMRDGAYTYITKPFLNEAVIEIVNKIAHLKKLEEENVRLRAAIDEQTYGELVGRSSRMGEVFRLIETVAQTDATVLIEGESGTGKERVAKAIHQRSQRKDGPFVAVSCASLPENLLESELFGHEKGAFTDAKEQKIGRFEMANRGTLFLDDVDDIDLSIQVKLLRVIQERNLERVGGDKSIDIDIRIIVATKVPLEKLVKAGRFREDLYWRLNVVPIVLPPLRDREGDIPLLVQHFIQLYGGGREYIIRPEILAAMERYPWPGNIRELQNAMQRAITMAGKSQYLDKRNLLPLSAEFKTAHQVPEEIASLREVVKNTERNYLLQVLQQAGWHRTQVAKLLGISRKVLWEKMKEHNIEEPKP